MTLITILVSLALQKLLGTGDFLHKKDWFSPYMQWIRMHLSDKGSKAYGLAQIIIAILPILLLVALVNYLFRNVLFGGLHFLLGVVVLFYCLNAPDLKKQLENYFVACEKQNLVEMQKFATQFLGYQPPNNIIGLNQAIIREIFLKTYEGIFAILFWYLILGVVGAVLYYLINELRKYAKNMDYSDKKLSTNIDEVCNLLDWIPARILVISFALMGHFVLTFTRCWHKMQAGLKNSKELIVSAGLAALDLKKKKLEDCITPIVQVIDLLNRTLILWIVVLAFFTIAAWLS